jgi:hypothetical protein
MDPFHSTGTPLKRRTFLAAALAAPLAGAAVGTASASATGSRATGRTFHVSQAGSDRADGLASTSAWRSVEQVNKALADGGITRGDQVLFHRGDTFYGALDAIPPSKDTTRQLAFGAYGTGALPQLTSYKVCTIAAGWTQYDSQTWRIDLSANSGAYTGNTGSANVNVGFLRVDGVVRARKRFTLDALAGDWDFYSDNTQYLYVRLAGNPALAGVVRAAVDGNLVTAQSSVAVRDLELVGSGGHGFRSPGLISNVTVSGCVIHEIGGSQLLSGPANTRYGNGVEIWIGGSDISVTSTQIYDAYDVAVTCQGKQTGAQTGWTRVHVTGCTIRNCTQSFEMWCQGTGTGSGYGFTDCSFAGNDCRQAGYSWGAGVRPDTAGKGTHLLFYDTELPCGGLSITDNTFYDAAQNYTYFAHTAPPAGMVVDKNRVSLLAGTKLEYQRAETIANAAAWTAATGLDRTSTFTVL